MGGLRLEQRAGIGQGSAHIPGHGAQLLCLLRLGVANPFYGIRAVDVRHQGLMVRVRFLARVADGDRDLDLDHCVSRGDHWNVKHRPRRLRLEAVPHIEANTDGSHGEAFALLARASHHPAGFVDCFQVCRFHSHPPVHNNLHIRDHLQAAHGRDAGRRAVLLLCPRRHALALLAWDAPRPRGDGVHPRRPGLVPRHPPCRFHPHRDHDHHEHVDWRLG
mmetsp:Transcript_49467/g.152628  ORF Transcript_49467/g.152628 Transcript_49467/m.152628 type:complete len:219 (-) Transcript_49467:813-1469(-)